MKNEITMEAWVKPPPKAEDECGFMKGTKDEGSFMEDESNAKNRCGGRTMGNAQYIIRCGRATESSAGFFIRLRNGYCGLGSKAYETSRACREGRKVGPFATKDKSCRVWRRSIGRRSFGRRRGEPASGIRLAGSFLGNRPGGVNVSFDGSASAILPTVAATRCPHRRVMRRRGRSLKLCRKRCLAS